MSFLRKLPYGRNAQRGDLSLIFSENKGTCSSKHATLKTIAIEQGIDEVHLILCIYKMNARNTPGIGPHIADAGLGYIPEAHCYLDIDGEKVDLTSTSASIARIENDILLEEKISPEQVNIYKVNTHKTFVQNWLASEQLQKTFEEIWSIREQCIVSLSS